MLTIKTFTFINNQIKEFFDMTTAHWDPFRNMSTLLDRINRIVEKATTRWQDYNDPGACRRIIIVTKK